MPQAAQHAEASPSSHLESTLELTRLYTADLENGVKAGNLWKIRRSSTLLEGMIIDLQLNSSLKALISIQRAAALANLTELPKQVACFLKTLSIESGQETWDTSLYH